MKKATRIVKVSRYVARLLIAVIMVLALAGFLPVGVQADDGNPVDLELGGEGATPWSITNIQPGDSGTKEVALRNVGTKHGFVTIWVSDIVSSEGINPESETGNTAEPGELDTYLLLDISSNRSSTTLTLPTTINRLPQSISDPKSIEIIPLKAGDTVDLQWAWNLPAQTGNDAQGDGVSFTINYLLKEFEITNVSNVVEEETGVFTQNVTVKSELSNSRATISQGTVGKTKEGESVSELWFIEMDKEPLDLSPDTTTISAHREAGPEGITFDQPVTIILSYDPNDIPARASEEDLGIATWDKDAGAWVELAGCTVDRVKHTVSARVTHFSRYIVLAHVSPPAPPPPSPGLELATFQVSHLTVQPAEVQPKETVTVTVVVTNTGDMRGSHTVVLKINGQKEAEKTVSVAADASEIVTFSVTREEPGSYRVGVDGLSASFTVIPRLAVDMLGKKGMVKIEADGTLREPLTLTDPDSRFVIEVDRGSKITSSDGIPITRIELTIVEESIAFSGDMVTLSPIYKVTGYINELEIPQINFDPSAKLTILYDPKNLPENAFPPFIANYTDELGLVRLEPPPDSIFEIGKAKAVIHRASLFAVMAELAPPPPPLPATFEVSNLTINPRRAEVGQPVIISLTIANKGAVTGSYELYLIVDGIVRVVKGITLAGQSIETISFEVSNLAAGKHQVKIAGLTGEFRIIHVAAALPAEAAIDWFFTDLWVGAVIAVGLLVLYLVIRRSQRLQHSPYSLDSIVKALRHKSEG